jgi:hypothetical protein
MRVTSRGTSECEAISAAFFTHKTIEGSNQLTVDTVGWSRAGL